MAGKGIADVLFCLDSSTSMEPCFDAVRKHIVSFVEGLKSDGQVEWDLRFDFVSHSTSSFKAGSEIVYRAQSIYETNLFHALYQNHAQADGAKLFTSSINDFVEKINKLHAGGDETNLIALDTCLDFPWRPGSDCHRVIILLTDETLETGLEIQEQLVKIPDLITKIHSLGVLLFMIGPDSAGYEELSAANRSTYDVVPKGNGLATVDFKRVLNQIGKSVSASRAQVIRGSVNKALFGQNTWVSSSRTEMRGA